MLRTVKSGLIYAVLGVAALLASGLIAGCGGGKTSIFTLSSVFSEVPAIAPESVSGLMLKMDATNTDSITQSAGVISAWRSLESSAAAFSSPSVPARPTLVSDGGYKYITFTGTQLMAADPVYPDHLGTQFSFVFAAKNLSPGVLFNFGTDSSTQAFDITVISTGLRLRHYLSSVAYRERSYVVDLAKTATAPIILGAVFGADGKDMELYINGFRQTVYTSAIIGSMSASPMVSRSFSSGLGAFSLGAIWGYKIKLTPRVVYALSREMASIWGAEVSASVTSEILNDTTPAIEPEVLNFAYVQSLVLQPKCYSCHSGTGGSSLRFNSYALLLSTLNASSQSLLVPSQPMNSRIYLAPNGGTMPPSGSALTASELEVLNSWIAAGAPE
jgi:hypothetical protein